MAFQSISRLLGTSLAITALLLGSAQAETYQIDPAHSSVAFSIRHLVSRTTGKFGEFSGSITYDPAKPLATQVEAVIQSASIDTDNEKRDGHLSSPDFFDVEKYPEITFKSTKAEKKGDMLIVTGQLSMHGVTKEIQLAVEERGTGEHPYSKMPVAGFGAELTLDRSEFGVDSWNDDFKVLGTEVKIMLNIEALVPAPKKE
jgi:polyisoprenoid-binding protein YceI